MKRLSILILTAALLAGSHSLPVRAEESYAPMGFHNYVTEEDYAEDTWNAAQRGAYLMNGTSVIARQDGTHVNISGATTGTQYCGKVKLTLYLERSTSYSKGYSTYRDYHFEADNVYQLVKEISNIKVERGYYYRVYGVHYVKENGVTETTNTVTDPLDYR